jgi:ParB/RepB/Spo0J family partition protein
MTQIEEQAVKTIDVRSVRVDEEITARKDYGDIDELKDSIIENGIIKPLHGYEKIGEYYLVDGHRRLKAIQKAIEEGHNITEVPFIAEKEGEEHELILMPLLHNDGKQLTPLELGEQYRKLVNIGFNLTEIAKSVGKTVRHVSSMVKITETSPTIKAAIKENRISATLVNEMSEKILDKEEAEKIIEAELDIKPKVTRKDVVDRMTPITPELFTEADTDEKSEDDRYTVAEVKVLLELQKRACAKEVPLGMRKKILEVKIVDFE